MRRPVSPLLRAAIGMALALAVLAGAMPAMAARYASFVMDADTGIVLRARHADRPRHPASLTKMMALYVTFGELKAGRISFDTKIRVSRRAAGQPASRLGLKKGQTITVRQAVLALITKSANDVATALAEHLGRTESRFAARMTRTARRLGMTRTVFRNASGLTNGRQLTTARDMARLAIALQRDFPGYYKLFKTRSFRYRGRTYRNHNRLLTRYSGTDGIKTGFTRAAGYNLVASARRGGHRLIGVVMGGKSGRSRNRHMIRLLDRGFARLPQELAKHRPPRPLDRPVRARPAPAATPVAAAAPPPKPEPVIRPAPKPARSAWSIQVGAFSGAARARQTVRTARGHLPELLRGAALRVDRVKGGGGTVFRARLTGLAEQEARRACNLLARRYLACYPVPPG